MAGQGKSWATTRIFNRRSSVRGLSNAPETGLAHEFARAGPRAWIAGAGLPRVTGRLAGGVSGIQSEHEQNGRSSSAFPLDQPEVAERGEDVEECKGVDRAR